MLTLNIIDRPEFKSTDQIDQTWTVKQIAEECPPFTWEDVFKEAHAEIDDIAQILDDQERKHGPYYPLRKDIFAAFNYTQLSNVKVVIVGQDPYHQTITRNGVSAPRAMGLSFSVHKDDSIPSSLQNIYKELSDTIRNITKPNHGDLREWAEQGVLLLNMCLTVAPGKAGAHGDLWLGFINKVLRAIANTNPYCIFLLWGREAQKVKPMLGEKSIIFEAAHPSGLSARRGFFGCNHFNLVNETLMKHGKSGIKWGLSDREELSDE